MDPFFENLKMSFYWVWFQLPSEARSSLGIATGHQTTEISSRRENGSSRGWTLWLHSHSPAGLSPSNSTLPRFHHWISRNFLTCHWQTYYWVRPLFYQGSASCLHRHTWSPRVSEGGLSHCLWFQHSFQGRPWGLNVCPSAYNTDALLLGHNLFCSEERSPIISQRFRGPSSTSDSTANLIGWSLANQLLPASSYRFVITIKWKHRELYTVSGLLGRKEWLRKKIRNR